MSPPIRCRRMMGIWRATPAEMIVGATYLHCSIVYSPSDKQKANHGAKPCEPKACRAEHRGQKESKRRIFRARGPKTNASK